jgi:hypothetical protein
VVGTVAGAAAGHKVGEAVNPTVEDAYWSEHWRERDYVDSARPYSDYQPAYRYGWESRARHPNRSYNEVERDLERGWDRFRGESTLQWNEARNATRDARHRVERALPGDADRDGR